MVGAVIAGRGVRVTVGPVVLHWAGRCKWVSSSPKRVLAILVVEAGRFVRISLSSPTKWKTSGWVGVQ